MGYKHLKPSDVETIKSLLDKNVDFNLIEKLTGFSTWTIRRVKAGQYDFKFADPEENQTDNSVVETLLNKIIENQNTIISMIKNYMVELIENVQFEDGGKIIFPEDKYCRDDVLNTLIFCGYIVKVTHDDETKTVTFIFWKE